MESKDPQDPLISEVIEEWLKKYKKKTQHQYHSVVCKFLKSLGKPLNSPIGQIACSDIKSYVSTLLSTMKYKSANNNVTILKSFFGWLHKTYGVEDIAASIKYFKGNNKPAEKTKPKETDFYRDIKQNLVVDQPAPVKRNTDNMPIAQSANIDEALEKWIKQLENDKNLSPYYLYMAKKFAFNFRQFLYENIFTAQQIKNEHCHNYLKKVLSDSASYVSFEQETFFADNFVQWIKGKSTAEILPERGEL